MSVGLKPENEIEARENSRFNPDTARNLDYAEGGMDTVAGGRNLSAGENAAFDQLAASASDPSSISDRESQGSEPYVNKVTGPSSKRNRNQSIVLLKSAMPTVFVGGLSGLIITALMGSFGLMSPLMNLKENLTLNWDQQSYSASARSQKLLVKRLAEGDAKGCKIKITCRYTKPSDRMIKQLNKAGITAVDKNGKLIEKQRLLRGERPAHYVLPDGNKITPGNFRSELKKNPVMRSAFARAHNPRWVNWMDSIALKHLGKYGAKKSVPTDLADGNESKDGKKSKAQEKINSMGKGESIDKTSLEADIKKEGAEFGKRATKHGRGNTAIMTAAVGCAIIKSPAVVAKVLRAYRLRKLIPIGMMFLTIADGIKAEGDNQTGKPYITPELVSTAGSLLTQTYKQDNGKTLLSAMDSGGILYGMTGDPRNAVKLRSGDRFMPGVKGPLAQAATVGNNDAISTACRVATSQEAQVAASAANAVKATNPAGWAMLALDVIILAADKAGAIDAIIEGFANAATSIIGSLIGWDTVLEWFVGDETKDIKGEDLGDAIAVGTEVNMSELASAGGNIPLTVSQKTAYDREIVRPTQLAWAEEDRVNHSPLDASNPHTALGSIYTKLIPTFYGSTSMISKISGLISISSNTLSNTFSPIRQAYAVDSSQTLAKKWCKEDDLVVNSNAASSPLCAVQYGVPVGQMGKDSEVVADELYSDGQIDENGNVKEGSDLDEWMKTCGDANTLTLDQCIIDDNDSEKANYALFQIDKRIIDTMDTEPSVGGNTGMNTGTPGDFDKVVECPQNTKDLGVIKSLYSGSMVSNKKPNIRLCQLSSIGGVGDDGAKGQITGGAVLNAAAAGAFQAMGEAAKQDGINLSSTSSFRYPDSCSGGGDGTACAKPGTSLHQLGVAIDFALTDGRKGSSTTDCSVRATSNDPVWKWLKEHAVEYGIKQYTYENWHWDMSGLSNRC